MDEKNLNAWEDGFARPLFTANMSERTNRVACFGSMNPKDLLPKAGTESAKAAKSTGQRISTTGQKISSGGYSFAICGLALPVYSGWAALRRRWGLRGMIPPNKSAFVPQMRILPSLRDAVLATPLSMLSMF